MDVMIIGNPVAGTGKTVQRVQELVRILESRGHKVEVFFTGKPGDAFDRAGTIRENVNRIVIAGGDGTVNEVLNGLPDLTACLAASASRNLMRTSVRQRT